MNFKANCISRSGEATPAATVDVICPNPLAVGSPANPVPGGEKYGWLKMLKNSVRNSTPYLSPKVVRLNTAKSKLLIPGERREESARASLPKPHSGGAAKQDVLNHWVMCPPPADLSQPDTTFGRMLDTPKLAASRAVAGPAQVIFRGNPRWNVVIPSMPQPETTLSAAPLNPEANLLPCPKGKSRT